MASEINPSFPIPIEPSTESVRQNFAIARDEITDLQNRLEGIGGNGTGVSVSFSSITGQPADNAALNSALNARQLTLVNTVNIRSVNGQSLLGSGNIQIEGGGTPGPVSFASITGQPTDNFNLNAALNLRALASNVPTLAAFDSLVARVEALESGVSPGVSWQVTFTYPDHMVFSRFVPPPSGGTIPLTSWTGWNPAYAADMTDDALYGPHLTNQDQLPVQMYATFVGQPEVRVDFDNWGGTAGENKITDWGFLSGEMAVTVRGSNGTGNPIQLRLVRA